MKFDNFTIQEFSKHLSKQECQNVLSNDLLYWNLTACLICAQIIRSNVGLPMIISSSYRDRAHNAREHGAPRSRHLWALAFDFHTNQKAKFLPYLKESMFISKYIEYPWGFHVEPDVEQISHFRITLEKIATVQSQIPPK